MLKRVMVSVVGAGLGAFVGLAASFAGVASSVALIGGAAVGAVLPQVLLGRPGR